MKQQSKFRVVSGVSPGPADGSGFDVRWSRLNRPLGICEHLLPYSGGGFYQNLAGQAYSAIVSVEETRSHRWNQTIIGTFGTASHGWMPDAGVSRFWSDDWDIEQGGQADQGNEREQADSHPQSRRAG